MKIRPDDSPDVTVTRPGDRWDIEVRLGKVQPGARAWTRDELVIGSARPETIICEGRLFGDSLDPTPIRLALRIDPSLRAMTVEDLHAESRKRYPDSYDED